MRLLPDRLAAVFRGSWWCPRRVRTCLVAVGGVLVVLTLLELLWPAAPAVAGEDLIGVGAGVPGGSASTVEWLAAVERRSLFEPAVPLPSRGMAKQSVDRILSQLSLNAILRVEGQHVAYIRVKGLGLKRFREGEQLEDLFRVVRIQERCVELEVAGERVRLEL